MELEIKNLCVSIKDKNILEDFNLLIKPGEVHAIMGPNGTGKSTLSKVIMGDSNYKITSGDILVNGKSILNVPTYKRARMGLFLCYQNPISIDGITNSEFIRTAINENRDKPIGLYDFIKSMENGIESLSMSSDMMHRFLNSGFSGGERKKNEVLQMKMLKPKFIIFDELDSGLDVDSLKIVCDNINDYLKDNPDTSVLLITHYTRILKYIKPLFVHMMRNGTITLNGNYNLAEKIEKYGYDKTDLLGCEDYDE